jgi:UDP-2,4-diacetamido-2,4,6-trideoxy-beta-L-altropyranose hydrolase
VQRILLFFGGSDPTDETSKTLRAFSLIMERSSSLLKGVQIDVIIGSGNPRKASLEHLVDSIPATNLHCQISNMAEFMLKADLMIGAGGSSTWERLFLGLPSLTIIIADNQAEVTLAIEELGMTRNLGWYHQLDEQMLSFHIEQILQQPEQLMDMQRKALAFMGDAASRHVSSASMWMMEDYNRYGK